MKLVAIDVVNDFVGNLQSNDDAQARAIVTPSPVSRGDIN